MARKRDGERPDPQDRITRWERMQAAGWQIRVDPRTGRKSVALSVDRRDVFVPPTTS
jgi:hypothetical protein